MSSRPLRVLYVGGSGRSGSTLIGRILGQAPGAVCVGETHYLWSRALQQDVLCGCGHPFSACAFWGEVGERAFGGWDRLDADRMVALDRELNRMRALPVHGARRVSPRIRGRIALYTRVLTRLYEAIADTAEAELIVETSKAPPFASLLGMVPGVELRIAHLVRDSRAVAYSWTRRRPQPGAAGAQVLMPRFSPRVSAANWLAANAAFGALARGHAYTRLFYERFAQAPGAVTDGLAAFGGVDSPQAARELDTSSGVTLACDHIFSGNPMRAESGFVPVKADGEWRERLPRNAFAQVTAITAPLLLRYGYPLSGR